MPTGRDLSVFGCPVPHRNGAVRQALGVLRSAGLIESALGLRIFVIAQAEQIKPRAPAHDPLALSDLGRDLTGMETPQLHVRKHHYTKAQPYLLADLWLPQHYFDMLPEGADETQLYSQLSRDHTGLTDLSGYQIITIVRADVATAHLLGVTFSEPVARVVSRLFDPEGRPVIAHIAHIRCDVFTAEIAKGGFYGVPMEEQWGIGSRHQQGISGHAGDRALRCGGQFCGADQHFRAATCGRLWHRRTEGPDAAAADPGGTPLLLWRH